MGDGALLWRFLLALAVAFTATFPSRAFCEPAGSKGRVVLDIKVCGGPSSEEVRRIVGVEIGDLLVEAAEPAPSTADRLVIRCADTMAWVEATSQAGGKSVDRTLRLDDFPGDAAPRALALAGIEILASLSPAVRERVSVRPAPRSEATPAPSATVDVPQSRPSTEDNRHPLRLDVAGLWRTFSVAHGASAWGGRIGLNQEFGQHWQLAADVDAAGTSTTGTAIGQARALLVSGGLLLGVHAETQNLGVGVSLGGRIGLAHLAGDSNGRADIAATSVARAWGGPVASLAAFAGVGPLGLIMVVEAGRSLFTSEGLANDQPVLSVGGNWLAVAVGAGFLFR